MNPTIEEIFRDESYHAIRESQNTSMKPKSKGNELRELFENLDHRANMGDVWDLIESLECEIDSTYNKVRELATRLDLFADGYSETRQSIFDLFAILPDDKKSSRL